ncbi:hypothetical protein NFI96_031383, partial [Prochilodus magdalenae]
MISNNCFTNDHQTLSLSHTDSEGLVSVSSWLLFSPSSEREWISCSVGVSDQEMKEGRVLLPKPTKTPPAPVPQGWKGFTILLVISLLGFTIMPAVFIHKMRVQKVRKDPEHSPAVKLEEQKHLLGTNAEKSKEGESKAASSPPTESTPVQETNTGKEIPDWETMLSCKVAVRPDASSTSLLEVGRRQDRVTCKSDVQDKTRLVHVLCKERISSGRYYWEIKSLIEPYTEKYIWSTTYKCPTSWYVGVTSESAEKKRKVPLAPQNGYWVLQYDRDRGYYVNDPSLTPVLVRRQVSKLGVFIDCEKHTLSFYDCDKLSHLHTFYNVPSSPSSPLIPVLSP